MWDQEDEHFLRPEDRINSADPKPACKAVTDSPSDAVEHAAICGHQMESLVHRHTRLDSLKSSGLWKFIHFLCTKYVFF